MKTFTLRLSDAEAEILERLEKAYLFESSKNKVIVRLLKDCYSGLDPMYGLLGIVSDIEDLAEGYYERITKTPDEAHTMRELEIVERLIIFALYRCEDPSKKENLTRMKEDIMTRWNDKCQEYHDAEKGSLN